MTLRAGFKDLDSGGLANGFDELTSGECFANGDLDNFMFMLDVGHETSPKLTDTESSAIATVFVLDILALDRGDNDSPLS